MANEDKKDFNAMLLDNKDMPKFQIITDVKSIEKYGGRTACRKVWRIGENRFQMGDRIEYAGSKYIG